MKYFTILFIACLAVIFSSCSAKLEMPFQKAISITNNLSKSIPQRTNVGLEGSNWVVNGTLSGPKIILIPFSEKVHENMTILTFLPNHHVKQWTYKGMPKCGNGVTSISKQKSTWELEKNSKNRLTLHVFGAIGPASTYENWSEFTIDDSRTDCLVLNRTKEINNKYVDATSATIKNGVWTFPEPLY